MASLCTKIVVNSSKRNVLFAARCFASKATMGDPIEHATGLEKRELLAKAAGNDDPFDLKILKRGPGTKTNPNVIQSAFEARLVGCVCEEDATSVTWMWLHKGQPKRCECGHWFNLVHKPAI